jgi:hypothetical protein
MVSVETAGEKLRDAVIYDVKNATERGIGRALTREEIDLLVNIVTSSKEDWEEFKNNLTQAPWMYEWIYTGLIIGLVQKVILAIKERGGEIILPRGGM